MSRRGLLYKQATVQATKRALERWPDQCGALFVAYTVAVDGQIIVAPVAHARRAAQRIGYGISQDWEE